MEEGLEETEVEHYEILLLVVEFGEGLANQVVFDVGGEGLFDPQDSPELVESVLLFEIGIRFLYSEEFVENRQGELIVYARLINLQLKLPRLLDILNDVLTVFFLLLLQILFEAVVVGRRAFILSVVLPSVEQVAADHGKAPGLAYLLVFLLDLAHRQVVTLKLQSSIIFACFWVFEQAVQSICDVVKYFLACSVLFIFI